MHNKHPQRSSSIQPDRNIAIIGIESNPKDRTEWSDEDFEFENEINENHDYANSDLSLPLSLKKDTLCNEDMKIIDEKFEEEMDDWDAEFGISVNQQEPAKLSFTQQELSNNFEFYLNDTQIPKQRLFSVEKLYRHVIIKYPKVSILPSEKTSDGFSQFSERDHEEWLQNLFAFKTSSSILIKPFSELLQSDGSEQEKKVFDYFQTNSRFFWDLISKKLFREASMKLSDLVETVFQEFKEVSVLKRFSNDLNSQIYTIGKHLGADSSVDKAISLLKSMDASNAVFADILRLEIKAHHMMISNSKIELKDIKNQIFNLSQTINASPEQILEASLACYLISIWQSPLTMENINVSYQSKDESHEPYDENELENLTKLYSKCSASLTKAKAALVLANNSLDPENYTFECIFILWKLSKNTNIKPLTFKISKHALLLYADSLLTNSKYKYSILVSKVLCSHFQIESKYVGRAAKISSSFKDFTSSIFFYEELLMIYYKERQFNEYLHVNEMIFDCYKKSGKHEKAIQTYSNLTKLFENDIRIIPIYNALLETYIEVWDFDSALKLFIEIMTKKNSVHDSKTIFLGIQVLMKLDFIAESESFLQLIAPTSTAKKNDTIPSPSECIFPIWTNISSKSIDSIDFSSLHSKLYRQKRLFSAAFEYAKNNYEKSKIIMEYFAHCNRMEPLVSFRSTTVAQEFLETALQALQELEIEKKHYQIAKLKMLTSGFLLKYCALSLPLNSNIEEELGSLLPKKDTYSTIGSFLLESLDFYLQNALILGAIENYLLMSILYDMIGGLELSDKYFNESVRLLKDTFAVDSIFPFTNKLKTFKRISQTYLMILKKDAIKRKNNQQLFDFFINVSLQKNTHRTLSQYFKAQNNIVNSNSTITSSIATERSSIYDSLENPEEESKLSNDILTFQIKTFFRTLTYKTHLKQNFDSVEINARLNAIKSLQEKVGKFKKLHKSESENDLSSTFYADSIYLMASIIPDNLVIYRPKENTIDEIRLFDSTPSIINPYTLKVKILLKSFDSEATVEFLRDCTWNDFFTSLSNVSSPGDSSNNFIRWHEISQGFLNALSLKSSKNSNMSTLSLKRFRMPGNNALTFDVYQLKIDPNSASQFVKINIDKKNDKIMHYFSPEDLKSNVVLGLCPHESFGKTVPDFNCANLKATILAWHELLSKSNDSNEVFKLRLKLIKDFNILLGKVCIDLSNYSTKTLKFFTDAEASVFPWEILINCPMIRVCPMLRSLNNCETIDCIRQNATLKLITCISKSNHTCTDGLVPFIPKATQILTNFHQRSSLDSCKNIWFFTKTKNNKSKQFKNVLLLEVDNTIKLDNLFRSLRESKSIFTTIVFPASYQYSFFQEDYLLLKSMFSGLAIFVPEISISTVLENLNEYIEASYACKNENTIDWLSGCLLGIQKSISVPLTIVPI